jgi:hypothetical protein
VKCATKLRSDEQGGQDSQSYKIDIHLYER